MRWLLLPLQILATVRPARAIVDTCDVCGRHPLVPRHDQSEQVVSSTDALPGAWPWIVSLQLPTITGHKHTCGGSLVSGRWILTAAHCFTNKRDLPHWRAVVGAWRLSSLGSEVHVRYIKRIVIHEDYQRNTETSDIALMELDQPVKCSDYIQPACLPDATVTVSLLTHCYISGWGILGKAAVREVSDVMHEVKVSRFSVAQCNSSDWYNGAIENHTLCAGYEEGGADICQGDSGGPLMCQEDGSQLFWIIGVTSWGQGCGKAHKPGVYTATQHFYSWIKQLAGPMPQPPPTPMPIPTIKIVLQSESASHPTSSPASSPSPSVVTKAPAHLPTVLQTTLQAKPLVFFWPPTTAQAPSQPKTQPISQSTSEVPPKPTSQLHAKSPNPFKVELLLQPTTQAPSSPHAKPSPSSPTPHSLKAEVPSQTITQVPPQSQAKPSSTPHSLKAEVPSQTITQVPPQSQAKPSSTPYSLKTEVPSQTISQAPPQSQAKPSSPSPPKAEVSIQSTSQVLSPSPPPEAEVLPEPQATPLLEIEILSQPISQAPSQPPSPSKTEVTSQLASIIQPTLQTPSQPKTKPLPEPEIPTKIGSTSQTQPQPSPETESEPEPEASYQSITTPQPTSKAPPQSEPQPSPQTHSKAELEAPTQPMTTFQSTSEASPQSEPQPSPQTKSEPESGTSSQLVIILQTSEAPMQSEPQASLQTESKQEPETPLPSTTLQLTLETSPSTSQPPSETMSQPETSTQPKLTSISHLETKSPKAETPSQMLPEAELEVPPIIETSRTDSTVAKFFRMIQEFLHIVKKEKDAVWVWPKLSELKLIKDTGVASLKDPESPPATDLPAESGGPCKLKGNPSMPLAHRCPTRVEKS